MNTLRSLAPWLDARLIAGRLQVAGAELLVALGAEAWCNKCKALRPAFEALCAAQAPAHVTWLWLDLDEHAALLGNFVPDDLPLVLRWRAGELVQAAVLRGIDPEARPGERLEGVPLPPDAPALWVTLQQQDWAQ